MLDSGIASSKEVAEVTKAVVDSPENEQGQAWWFLDTLVIEHRCAPGMDTVVLEMTLPVGSAPPLHVHDDLDDTWYILDGQMVVRCGDETLLVGAGDWVSMPRGVPHTFRVVGERESFWCTTTLASATSFETSAVQRRRVWFRPSRSSLRWTSWRALPPHTTSGRSGPR
jgi:mannose-6-phosphate isomerase-like protein (cupin superfamily)